MAQSRSGWWGDAGSVPSLQTNHRRPVRIVRSLDDPSGVSPTRQLTKPTFSLSRTFQNFPGGNFLASSSSVSWRRRRRLPSCSPVCWTCAGPVCFDMQEQDQSARCGGLGPAEPGSLRTNDTFKTFLSTKYATVDFEVHIRTFSSLEESLGRKE